MLARGGTGYFRMAAVRALLEEGRLALVPDSLEFSYLAYMVHSTRTDESVVSRIRAGLRAAATMQRMG